MGYESLTDNLSEPGVTIIRFGKTEKSKDSKDELEKISNGSNGDLKPTVTKPSEPTQYQVDQDHQNTSKAFPKSVSKALSFKLKL